MKPISTSCWLRLFVLWLVLGLASAKAYHPELIEAANAYARGEATALQEAMLIARNRDLQRLAIYKNRYIRDSVFQKCQAFYVDEVTKIAVEEAAELRKTGKSISVVRQQAKPGSFSGGTDLDLITQGKTTPADISALQTRISQRLDALTEPYLSKNPGKRPSDWFKANDIDLMADPRHTTPEDFRAISRQNNFAYERPDAARFEEWQRLHPNERPPLRMEEMAEYMDEMKSAASRRDLEIQKLRREIAEARRVPGASMEGGPAWKRIRDLETDLHVVQGQKSKLIDRMHETTDVLMNQLPVDRRPVRGSSLAHKGKGRDLAGNAVNPKLASSLEKELVEDAFARHAEALAAVSKTHPELAEACAENLRRTAGHLSAKKQVEVVESIKKMQGADVAESAWQALKSGGKRALDVPPQSLAAAARSASEAAEGLGHALRVQNHEEALQQLRRLRRDMALAQKFGQVPGTVSGVDDLLRRADDLYSQAGKLAAKDRGVFLRKHLRSLFQDPALRAPLNDFLKRAKVESSVLEALARETDKVRRGMLRGILSEGGAFRELRNGIGRLAEQLPIETILTGVFAALDVIRAEEAHRGGRFDEAMRAAFEAAVGIAGGAVVGLVTAVGNMVIDAAKEGGYILATGAQDLEDFLAGIVSVKGWESALDKASPAETSLVALARQHATSQGLEAALDKLIQDAAAQSRDKPEVRAGKEKALKAKLWPQLHAAWLRLRMEEVNRLVARFEGLDVLMQEFAVEGISTPENPELLRRREGVNPRAEAELRLLAKGPVSDLNTTLEELRAGLRALGGEGQQMSLGVLQEITLRVKESGEEFQVRHTDVERLLIEKVLSFEKPGEYTLEFESVLTLRPYSTVTEQSQEVRESWSLFAPLAGVKYDPRKQEWSLRWVPFSHREEITHNDQYRIIEFAREYRHKSEMKVQVMDKGGDDRVIARVTAPRNELLVGESLLASVELDSRARLGDDIRLRWSGEVKPMEKEALFVARKAGTFRIGASVYREVEGKLVKLTDAEAMDVRVHAAEDLTFSLKIRGPSRGKTGEGFRLEAQRFVIPAGADKALEGMVVEWSSDGSVLDVGLYTVLEPVEAGEYLILARLLDETAKVPVERARATWRVVVTGEPANVGGLGGSDDEPEPAGEPAQSSAATSSGAAKKAPADSTHSAMYGSTLELDFSDGREKRIAESNRELSEAMKKANAKKQPSSRVPVTGGPFDVRTDVPGVYNPEPRIPAGDEIDDVVREPDLPPTEEDVPEKLYRYCPKCGSESYSSTVMVAGSPLEKCARCGNLGFVILSEPFGKKTNPAATPKPADPLAAVRFRYIFHASPTLEFDPPESDDGLTRVTLARVGEVQLWAQVVTEWEEDGETLSKTEETAKRIYTVTPPEFSLITSPENPKIGEEIKVRVVASPAVSPELLRMVWIEPSARLVLGGNGESIAFDMPASGSTRMRVEIREPYWGTALGTAEATLNASQYQVSAVVLGRTGPRPQVWDAKQGGLVDIPENAYLVHEAIRLKATLRGTPAPKTVRWQWTVTPGSTLRGSGISDAVSVTRSEAGTAEAQVEARDGNGALLGSATVTVPFMADSVEPPKEASAATAKPAPQGENEAKKEVEAGYAAEKKGQLEKAVEHYSNAQRLKPDPRVAARIRHVESTKARINTYLAASRKRMDAQEFAEADRELSAAKNLHNYYPSVQTVSRELSERWIKFRYATEKRMDDIRVSNQDKKFAETLALAAAYRKEMRVDESVIKDLEQAEAWARNNLENQNRIIAEFRKAEGLLNAGNYAESVAAYEKAMVNTAQYFPGNDPDVGRANEKMTEARKKWAEQKRQQAAKPVPTTTPATTSADGGRSMGLASVDMLGEWDHVGNRTSTTLIVKEQSGNTFSGIMHGDPLINGKISGNQVTFTRDIPQRQDYTGKVVVAADGRVTMSGTFTQKGLSGVYNWSSTRRNKIPVTEVGTAHGKETNVSGLGPSAVETKTASAWVLVERKAVRGEVPAAVEGGEVRADIGHDSIELLLAKPYGIGLYSSRDPQNPQRLHARYSWSVPETIEPGGTLEIPLKQQVFSNKTGKWANSFGVGVTIANNWEVSGKTAEGDAVKPYVLGIGSGKPAWAQQDVSVTYERVWLWKEGKEGDKRVVTVVVQGAGTQKIEYTYAWQHAPAQTDGEAEVKNDAARISVENGYASEKAGRLDEALKHYNEAQRLKPDPRVAERIRHVEMLKERQAESSAPAKQMPAVAAPRSFAGTFEFRHPEVGRVTLRVEPLGEERYRAHFSLVDPDGLSDSSSMRASGRGRILTIYPEDDGPEKLELSADGNSLTMQSEEGMILKRIR